MLENGILVNDFRLFFSLVLITELFFPLYCELLQFILCFLAKTKRILYNYDMINALLKIPAYHGASSQFFWGVWVFEKKGSYCYRNSENAL